MKIWQWFCKLGDKREGYKRQVKSLSVSSKKVSKSVSQSGVDMVCSRVCGHEGCRCGSTIRGLHCVWSYYRLEE